MRLKALGAKIEKEEDGNKDEENELQRTFDPLNPI